jgi:Mn2+/Fe2+ NRAMP family transporter
MRFGISVAIILGGIISIAILVTGSMLNESFSFEALAAKMDLLMAGNGSALLGIGLFCAGFTSSITAPMAAAITWQSISGRNQDLRSTGFRIVWGAIMLVGLLFGISGLKPIPVILLAQALNGLLLPISAIFLIIIINDHKLMKAGFGNTSLQNALLILVVWLALLLGIHSLAKVAATLIDGFAANGVIYLISISSIALLILWVSLKGRVGRQRSSD